jgi:hypothetical protein
LPEAQTGRFSMQACLANQLIAWLVAVIESQRQVRVSA